MTVANPPNREIGSISVGLAAAQEQQNPAAAAVMMDATAEMETEEKKGDEGGDGNESEA